MTMTDVSHDRPTDIPTVYQYSEAEIYDWQLGIEHMGKDRGHGNGPEPKPHFKAYFNDTVDDSCTVT